MNTANRDMSNGANSSSAAPSRRSVLSLVPAVLLARWWKLRSQEIEPPIPPAASEHVANGDNQQIAYAWSYTSDVDATNGVGESYATTYYYSKDGRLLDVVDDSDPEAGILV